MNTAYIFLIGFIAQLFFSARMLVQWIKSETSGRVVSPVSFWLFSLGGALLMILYGMLRQDIIIITGQMILYYIYLRNLMLKRVWSRVINKAVIVLLLLPFIMSAGLYFGGFTGMAPILYNQAISYPVLVWGAISTTLFSSRFFYQWILSEKSDDSIFPMGFWLISIVGAFMLLIYGILRRDPVIILGQLFSNITFVRNIILLKRVGIAQSVPPAISQ
jgi:lipid-A-disaccharide synthase-like uncharacterized protein